MKMFKNPLIGKKAGVQFSGKTTNWMLNIKNGCYRDAVALLERVELVHRLLHKRCEREVKIWK